MKTIFITLSRKLLTAAGLSIVFGVNILCAQSQNWWRTNGNTPQNTDFLGTSNNSPLIIKTNNTERVRIAPNGFVGVGTANPQYLLDVNGRTKLRFNVYCDSMLQCSSLKADNLSGNGNALLITDAQGNIMRMNFSGNNNDVLTGNGYWTSISSLLPPALWQSNGQNIFYTNGYVGIGTNSPLFSLDVVGDVRVSNNIYVGGGIVISDKVNAFTEVTAPKMVASEANLSRMKADSIMMDSTKAIYGNTIVKGDVKLENKLTIQGNAKFNGPLTATQGVMFNDSVGFKLINTSNNTSNSSTGSSILFYGKGLPPPPPVNPCTNPGALPIFQIGGAAQLLWNNTSLTLWADGANSIIDHQGNGSLLINYSCGKDVVIGNATSGNLLVNQKLGVGTGNPQKLMHVNNSNGDADILIQSGAGKSTLWTINNNLSFGFGIDANGNGHIWKDLNNPMDIVTFSSNGSVGINLNGGGLNASQITNALNNNKLVVNGQILAIEYTAKYLSDWPDYVFKRKNKSLSEIENYIQVNNHLPGFESARYYEENGIKLTDIIVKQQEKIEEIFLYLIELKKENETLKKEIEKLKKK